MTNNLDRQHRATDRPLNDPLHDDFQRGSFAQRIADTLISRVNPDSIVIGMYGSWGEGKSTVLNFIRHELGRVTDKVVVLNFNPWRFTDETQLLTNFFGELAKTIDRQLLTPGQRAAKLAAEYVAPLLPKVTFSAQVDGPSTEVDFSTQVQALLNKAQPDADGLRQRIEQLLADAGRRVIVIVDDIDRLEKGQIQALFRLVKLTADFRHTAYVLAFDDSMVARALGEVFSPAGEAATAQQAGHNFLEKIIQVPLRLPRARADDLFDFCLARLNEVCQSQNIEPDAEDAQRVSNTLRAALLPRLTTPRLAVRYANAVEFGLPLLYREVNLADFILVEALHLFYPELHRFVATHPELLTGSTQRSDGNYEFLPEVGSDPKKPKIEHFLDNHYPQREERQATQHLLCTLFPRVSRHFNRSRSLFDDSPSRLSNTELAQRQHVAAPTHFARYFAYTILRDDVADQEFAAFLAQPPAQQFSTSQDLIGRLGISTFLQKLAYRVDLLSPVEATNGWYLLRQLSPSISDERVGWFSGRTDLSQSAWLLVALLARLPADQRLPHILDLLDSDAAFSLCERLVSQLLTRRTKALAKPLEDQDDSTLDLFTRAEWEPMEQVLAATLVERALHEAGSQAIYTVFPVIGCRIMHLYWRLAANPQPLAEYVLPRLRRNPDEVVQLLQTCAPFVSVNHAPPFHGNIEEDTFAMLYQSVGPELYTVVRQVLGPEPILSYSADRFRSTPPSPRNASANIATYMSTRSIPLVSPDNT
ncbi:KAP family P-loop NTPase fold protein [Hymenobacter radiodurans]|uniref:KAP family P-loop NTPase fold protein n=1 Tax=Hymenobacter radiodurans TaxID=2496028 RepID=UPI001058ABD9|nr:P-loop NTPase fold protein [Hymenobacter radiodurans]